MGFYYLTEQLKGFSKKQLIRMVQELKAELDENKWISVKDRLPKNDYYDDGYQKRYLVITEPLKRMLVARYGYKDKDWWIDNDNCVMSEKSWTEVTYWMPFPKPPSEE